jgi:UDP-N-acetyl-D-mannosaminuronate dehydrogenase
VEFLGDLLDKKYKLSLVGLGYVGLPIAVAYPI